MDGAGVFGPKLTSASANIETSASEPGLKFSTRHVNEYKFSVSLGVGPYRNS